jgi:3-deoxy-D-manno-octulosonate 8-phosphate phosphatase (KDO 8-P phosphatase)
MDIKFLVMDVDGTLTDGMVYLGNEGELFKAFNVKDGYGIHYLVPAAGIIPVIITGRNSKIMEHRCREIEIDELYQGVHNKTEVLEAVLKKYSLKDGVSYGFKNVAYIGDDLNDLSVMRSVKNGGGIVACPSDAVRDVIETADFVSDKVGGNGAVRDFIDSVLITK